MDMKHRMWKHVKSDGIYQILGSAVFKGAPNSVGNGAEVVLVRPLRSDGDSLDAFGANDAITVSELAGKACAGLDKDAQLAAEERLVFYRGTDARCWVRPVKDFFDGRFIKLDDNLQPLVESVAPAVAHALDTGKAFAKAVAAKDAEGS